MPKFKIFYDIFVLKFIFLEKTKKNWIFFLKRTLFFSKTYKNYVQTKNGFPDLEKPSKYPPEGKTLVSNKKNIKFDVNFEKSVLGF